MNTLISLFILSSTVRTEAAVLVIRYCLKVLLSLIVIQFGDLLKNINITGVVKTNIF